MESISAVIITYNEEINIERCLNSLKGIADEIIVVDSISTDQTKSICLKNGAHFVEHVFEGHIQQKNFALSLANSSFILSLDADETLDESLKNSILRIKQKPEADVYSMNRLTNYCGKWIYHCGWYPDRKVRLIRKGFALWGGVNPHDELKFKEDAIKGHLEGNILHYSYSSIHQHIQQANHFSGINAKEWFEKGKKASLMKVIFSPWIRFIRDYIVWGGFLDGYYGLVICRISSHAAFLKYIKIRELWKQQSQSSGFPKAT